MSTVATPANRKLSRNQSILLVVFCTFIGAAAQILLKMGANEFKLVGGAAILSNPLLILRNFSLMGGLALYGLFTLLFIFALRDGELSVMYPIITLNYVWVMLLSVFLFNEVLNTYKLIGVSSIMLGVILVGKGGRK